ncbi:MAG: tetratricopeptide repeat protein [Deltaproteobacteria bacterium]|nr:MAG: tetratricopeptide repeat protein [Deltaproteobacteria bacterium]
MKTKGMETTSTPPTHRPQKSKLRIWLAGLLLSACLIASPLFTAPVQAQATPVPQRQRTVPPAPSTAQAKPAQRKNTYNTQEWQQQLRYQQYRPRRRGWFDVLIGVFYWLLYSIWFWILLAVFVLPYISVWLAQRRKLKNFTRARMAELANPIDAGARFQLGSMLLKQRRYRRALPYLQEAHNIQREQKCLDPRVLDALGNVKLALGKRDEAIELLKESLTLDKTGNQGEVFLQLGRAYQEKKEHKTAEEWLEKACEANRSLAEPVYRMALHLNKTERGDEARKMIKEFLIDAHALPAFIRKRNRFWVFLMRIFPLGHWFV